jgi:hypothetical protein
VTEKKMSGTLMIVVPLLGVLTVFPSAAQKDNVSLTKKDNSVYAELAKAPRKAMARTGMISNAVS